MTQANDNSVTHCTSVHYLTHGGGETTEETKPLASRIVPHSRTLRKAREQVKQMVIDGVSPRRISGYLHRWSTWWVRTSESWEYEELLGWFLNACWAENPAAVFAAGLLYKAKKSHGATLLEEPRMRPLQLSESDFATAL